MASVGGQASGGGTNPAIGGQGVGGAPTSSASSVASGGGSVASGGSISTGGGSSSSGGGSSSTGGSVASGGSVSTGGGSSSTGGSVAKGGSSSTGGSVAKGGSSSTGGSSANGGSVATGGTTTGACATALAARVKTTQIAVSPNVNVTAYAINTPNRPVMLATAPNGTAKVAWSDGTQVHVTPLDNADNRAGSDVLLPGSEVHGLVAHDDGSALLIVRGDAMVFVRLNAAGAVQSELALVGGNAHTTEDDRWIDSWPHQGRLAWSGTQYAAYFGQTGNFGTTGNHQGDHYSLISATGTLQSGGWDWGCSHSLDERLAHNGTKFAPLCTSDTYPGAGIWFNNQVEVSAEPSITNMGAGAKLGGLVPATDGFYFTFTTPQGRASFDVAFVKIANNGTPSGKTYLTNTASVAEQFAYLAKYGDALLAGWATTAGALSIATVSTSGAITEGPVAVTARVGALDDFATYPNGDVGWAYAWTDLSKLQVTRVSRCP